MSQLVVNNRSLIDRWKHAVLSLTADDRVLILFDQDPDGMASGAAVARLLKRVAPRTQVERQGALRSTILSPEVFATVKQQHVTTVITTDLATEIEPALLRKLSTLARIIILDHHTVYSQPDTDRVLLIKPQLLFKECNAANFSTSMLAYYLSKDLTDLSDMDWIIAVGVISDIGYDYHTEFIADVFKKYRFRKDADFFKTVPGRMAEILNNAVIYDATLAPVCFDTLVHASSPLSVLRSRLRKPHATIQKEIDDWVKNVTTRATFSGDTLWYEITSRYHIKSAVSTILGLTYRHHTVLTVMTLGSVVSVSARRDDHQKNVAELLRTAAKGIPGSHAGGHPVSAGAGIPVRYFSQFKKRLFTLLHC